MNDNLDMDIHRRPILKNGVRIFTPIEYGVFRKVLKPEQQILTDSLLLTGMRYEELRRLREHEDWLDDDVIRLPSWADKKAKRKQRGRDIRLSYRGRAVLPNLFLIKIPTRSSFDHSLKRWAWRAYSGYGLDPTGISASAFRKTWGSWLMFCNFKDSYVYLSQGHDKWTDIEFYQGIAFKTRDRPSMDDWVAGWA